MNKHQEFLDLIEELNEQIAENKFFENLGMGFSYSTTGYSDLIKFGNFTLYCSENDSLSEWDVLSCQYIDISLKKFVIKQLFILSEEMFNISQELQKIKYE